MNFRNIFIAVAAISLAACNSNETAEQKAETTPVYKEETVAYTGDSVTMNGYLVYNPEPHMHHGRICRRSLGRSSDFGFKC